MASRGSARQQYTLLTLQFFGDLVVCYGGLVLGYVVRFLTPLRYVGVEAPDITLADYQPLLLVGTVFLIASFAYLRLYDSRLLLRPHRAMSIIMRGNFFWLIAYLGISLALKFEPAISRLFVVVSFITTLSATLLWRYVFYYILSRSKIRESIIQRVIIIGWSDEAAKLVEAIQTDLNHPYEIAGVLATRTDQETMVRGFLGRPLLGQLDELEAVLTRDQVEIAVVADLDLSKEQTLGIVTTCEQHYVAFKIIPSFFQIFVSNLRMQTISGVPILGVEALAILALPNQLLKRAIDILGGLVGLIISAPIMAVLAILIKRESPGPIIYRQVRTGTQGRPFTIYKMRSMRLDAEAGRAQWAVEGDPRRTRIGTFMRETNLDELPQFWNVLMGDMSLVGPRPERPELIAQFEKEIPHYNPRHEVRPGLTGWAQVNGLRGNTSLTDRIKYDLYYIENWSLWFDVQILLLTFVRQKNAY